MATITIVDENGKSKTLNQWKINDINIVQETGDAMDKVMSQKSVTDAINSMNLIECGNDVDYF